MNSGTVALIQARGGSKGVPGKNVRPLGGYPVIAWSIAAARLCPAVDRIIVSTDSPVIAEVSQRYGAEVPFLRPAVYATDTATDHEVVTHFLGWMAERESARPGLIVHLRPTTPLRDPGMIEGALRALGDRPDATALRSAHPLADPPQKMFVIEDGLFAGLFPQEPRVEYYNLPRQSFPTAYLPNGGVDILRPEVALESGGLHGSRILAHVTPPLLEIDTPADLDLLEYTLAARGHPLRDHLLAHFPVAA